MSHTRITFLADCPWHAPALARWHASQWAALLPEWSAPEALEELRTHTDRVRIDTTLVALHDGELAGSVSLIAVDHPQLVHRAPWLASLYVAPHARRRGIGEALVRCCVDVAAALEVPTLHLYTEDAQAMYERLGWRTIEHVALPTATVTVMAIEPALVSAAN